MGGNRRAGLGVGPMHGPRGCGQCCQIGGNRGIQGQVVWAGKVGPGLGPVLLLFPTMLQIKDLCNLYKSNWRGNHSSNKIKDHQKFLHYIPTSCNGCSSNGVDNDFISRFFHVNDKFFMFIDITQPKLHKWDRLCAWDGISYISYYPVW